MTAAILNERVFNDEPLTPAEEALLETLEQEYLTRLSAEGYENYDYFSIRNYTTVGKGLYE
jgi:hypothetical protein